MTGATRLVPQIDARTLQNLADPSPAASDILLYHTLYMTRAGGLKHGVFDGRFLIRQGVPG